MVAKEGTNRHQGKVMVSSCYDLLNVDFSTRTKLRQPSILLRSHSTRRIPCSPIKNFELVKVENSGRGK